MAFAAGQTAYDREGRKFEVRETFPNDRMLLVRVWERRDRELDEWFEYTDDKPVLGEGSNYFAEPPREAYDAQTVEARQRLEDIHIQMREAQKERDDAVRDRDVTLKALAEQPNLGRLTDFLAGNITHFVVTPSYGSNISIQTFDQFAVCRDDRGRDEGFKLLCLFGTRDRKVRWSMNHYSDGSGSWTSCVPCCSIEEAREVLAAKLAASWAAYDANPQQVWTQAEGIAAADRHGIAAPEHIRAAIAQHKAEALERSVTKAEEELAKARAALTKACAAGGSL